MSPTLHLSLLALSWFIYGATHSLLASARVKARLQRRFADHYPAYRLSYNLLALGLLAPPLWLLISYPGDALWHWPAPLNWLARAISLLAAGGFVWSLRYYDTAEFLGTRQLRTRRTALGEQAPMSLSPLHRWVRHPWYFLGLLILWTQEMNAALLITAITLTVYLVIGSRLEDRKLVACYGKPYRLYRERVPGLVPLPWRHLSKQDADDILEGTAPERRDASR
ncbi:MAG: hypothetical protein WAL92_06235 [Thiogranum sp.]